MSIFKSITTAVCAVVLTSVLCSKTSINEPASRGSGDASFYFVADAQSDFKAVARHAEVLVSASDMNLIRKDLVVDTLAGSISGSVVYIPVGAQRKFEVVVYTENKDSICYYGSAFADIDEGVTAPVTMTLSKYNGNGTGSAVINGTISDVNVPPTVSIVSPKDADKFPEGSIVNIVANAIDNDGTIAKVVFLLNDTTDLDMDPTDGSYSVPIPNLSKGIYTVKCIAIDNSNDTGFSETVMFAVVENVSNIPPTVEIVSPKTGDKVLAGSTLDIEMTASDADGEVVTILLYHGDTEIARFWKEQGPTLSATYSYGSIPKGYYNFTCKAVDNSYDTTVSDLVSIFVDDADTSDLLVKYGVPTADPLPSIQQRFTSVVTEGTGAPVMDNVTGVQINWSLENKGLWDFGINTRDGKPSWYTALNTKLTQSFANASPECTITGSGFAGLDGSYYATINESNLVLVEKTGKHAVIFKK